MRLLILAVTGSQDATVRSHPAAIRLTGQSANDHHTAEDLEALDLRTPAAAQTSPTDRQVTIVPDTDVGRMRTMPRLLVLGGSWFLGAQIVSDALAAGWEVHTFRRGQSGTTVPGATLIQGDRSNMDDLARLAAAGPWDAVADTSGYVPANVGMVARRLEPAAARFVFMSTVSVYQDWPNAPVDEQSALRECSPDRESDDGSVGDPGPRLYGEFKAGAERAVLQAFGTDRVVLLRPGVIVGPGEYVGRVPWWLRRIERGGRVLAPGRPEAIIQPVDVRDVSAAVFRLLDGPTGAINIAGADTPFVEFLAACQQVTGSAATLEWITDGQWLAEQVKPWVEMPFWHVHPAAWSVDTSRARARGLVPRPLAETTADVWDWMHGGDSPVEHPRARLIGISPDKERQVLARWDGHLSGRPG